MSLNAGQQQALVHLAVTTRPHGASHWDAWGVASWVKRLVDQGLSAQEVIDRTLAHAWDRSAKKPGVLAHPATRPAPVESNPVVYPVRKGEGECPVHIGQRAGACTFCASEAIGSDPKRKPVIYDDEGNRLRHPPLRDVFERAKAELENQPPADRSALTEGADT